ncbi:NAC domain-containing protein 101-like [Pistacia vera]|uniref:NAC domain-containing protein 101-like n=1 Tax=Pistacia vera TaxID=55513 RepID=UPI001263047B|nr:NAC domain-containing protein 101-like [Pistacia vera]
MEVVEFSRPVGYVFDPTDCELVGFYLSKKIANQLIPGIDYFIPEYNLYGSKEPWQIWNFFKPRLGEERDGQDLYFFTKLKKKTLKGSRIDRSVGTGTWQGEDGGTEIVSNNQRIGSKKRFRYENKDSNQHGGWIMHEYSLDSSLLLPDQHNNYVVCRIRKNHLALKKNNRRKCQEVDSEKKKKSKVQEVDSEPLPLATLPARSTTTTTTTMVQQPLQLEDETELYSDEHALAIRQYQYENQQNYSLYSTVNNLY